MTSYDLCLCRFLLAVHFNCHNDFQCCAVSNTSKKFSVMVVFQSQLKAAEQYFLFLSFFFPLSNESSQAVLPFGVVYYPAQGEILNILS